VDENKTAAAVTRRLSFSHVGKFSQEKKKELKGGGGGGILNNQQRGKDRIPQQNHVCAINSQERAGGGQMTDKPS